MTRIKIATSLCFESHAISVYYTQLLNRGRESDNFRLPCEKMYLTSSNKFYVIGIIFRIMYQGVRLTSPYGRKFFEI